MSAIPSVGLVSNRVFLFGLDTVYREAMKEAERSKLCECARVVAAALRVEPADVPVEGYYHEDPRLTEYFRLMRALQGLGEDREAEVGHLIEFRRLLEVSGSPIFGQPVRQGKLLPVGKDPLSQALLETQGLWTKYRLIRAACDAALSFDDFSLVGLAARIRDGVVLAGTRESVVLYALVAPKSARLSFEPKYLWRVDDDLASQANRFIETFNTLFDESLPPAVPESAGFYYGASRLADVAGRCVRIGYDPSTGKNYHWAIRQGMLGRLVVHDFWSAEVWTTERYRRERGGLRRLLRVGVQTSR